MPVKGLGSGKRTVSKCFTMSGAKRLFARRIVELTEIRAVRCFTGSSPARVIKLRFQSCTLLGVITENLTASTLRRHV